MLVGVLKREPSRDEFLLGHHFFPEQLFSAVEQIFQSSSIRLGRFDFGFTGRDLFRARHLLDAFELRFRQPQIGFQGAQLGFQMPVIDPEQWRSGDDPLAQLVIGHTDLQDNPGDGGS